MPNYQINELWSNSSAMLDADPHVLDWSRNRHWNNKGTWMGLLPFLISESGYHLTFWQTLRIVFMAQHSHVNANWVTKVYWLFTVYFLAFILNFRGIPFPTSSANIHHVLVQIQYSKQVHWTPLLGAIALLEKLNHPYQAWNVIQIICLYSNRLQALQMRFHQTLQLP